MQWRPTTLTVFTERVWFHSTERYVSGCLCLLNLVVKAGRDRTGPTRSSVRVLICTTTNVCRRSFMDDCLNNIALVDLWNFYKISCHVSLKPAIYLTLIKNQCFCNNSITAELRFISFDTQLDVDKRRYAVEFKKYRKTMIFLLNAKLSDVLPFCNCFISWQN